jgi:hypothetical protein
METKKTSNSQSKSEQKVQCWKFNNSFFQTILQSHNNKNRMVLPQKQTRIPMDKNRRPRHGPTQL